MGELGLEMEGNDNVRPPSTADFIVHKRSCRVLTMSAFV